MINHSHTLQFFFSQDKIITWAGCLKLGHDYLCKELFNAIVFRLFFLVCLGRNRTQGMRRRRAGSNNYSNQRYAIFSLFFSS